MGNPDQGAGFRTPGGLAENVATTDPSHPRSTLTPTHTSLSIDDITPVHGPRRDRFT